MKSGLQEGRPATRLHEARHKLQINRRVFDAPKRCPERREIPLAAPLRLDDSPEGREHVRQLQPGLPALRSGR